MIKTNLKIKPIRKIKKKGFLDKSVEIKLMQYADKVPMKQREKNAIKGFLSVMPEYRKIVSAMKLSKNIMNKYNKTLINHPQNQKIPKYLKETIKKLKKSERKIFFDRITRDKDTGLTDTQKKEIVAQELDRIFAIPGHKDTPECMDDIDVLINKYGFTPEIKKRLCEEIVDKQSVSEKSEFNLTNESLLSLFNEDERKERTRDLKMIKDTGLTDTQQKEIDETLFIEQDIAKVFPIYKKYINNKYLLYHLSNLNLETRNTLKTFSKGKDTKLSEVGKLINKYGFTRLIQMFLRDYGFDFLFENKIKTREKIKKNLLV